MHGQFDLSKRAIEDPPPPTTGVVERALITMGGFPAKWAVKHGTQNEIWDIKLVGGASFLYFIIWVVSVTTGLHVIFDFGRSFNFGLIIPALLIAAAQGVTDHIIKIKGAIRENGDAALRRASIKLPTEFAAKSYRWVRRARAGTGLAFAAFTFVFGMLAAEGGGIQQVFRVDFQKNGGTAYAQAAQQEDEKKARDVAGYNAADADFNNLSRANTSLQSNMARSALAAGRKPAADNKRLVVSAEQLNKQVAEAEARRERFRQAVERDDAERNATIGKFVSSSPQAASYRTDLAAQLGALWQLIAESPLMWVISALLLTIGFSLELGFMWLAASYRHARAMPRPDHASARH
jgi:hypothetical protein